MMNRIGALNYLECDAKNGEGLRDVFECACREAMSHKNSKEKSTIEKNPKEKRSITEKIFGSRGSKKSVDRSAKV
jgi:hypothetical protein